MLSADAYVFTATHIYLTVVISERVFLFFFFFAWPVFFPNLHHSRGCLIDLRFRRALRKYVYALPKTVKGAVKAYADLDWLPQSLFPGRPWGTFAGGLRCVIGILQMENSSHTVRHRKVYTWNRHRVSNSTHSPKSIIMEASA